MKKDNLQRGNTKAKNVKKINLETTLRLEIKSQLEKVTAVNSPLVWVAIHKANGKVNTNGYSRVESRIIEKIIAGQLTPSAAVPQLEQEMDLR